MIESTISIRHPNRVDPSPGLMRSTMSALCSGATHTAKYALDIASSMLPWVASFGGPAVLTAHIINSIQLSGDPNREDEDFQNLISDCKAFLPWVVGALTHTLAGAFFGPLNTSAKVFNPTATSGVLGSAPGRGMTYSLDAVRWMTFFIGLTAAAIATPSRQLAAIDDLIDQDASKGEMMSAANNVALYIGLLGSMASAIGTNVLSKEFAHYQQSSDNKHLGKSICDRLAAGCENLKKSLCNPQDWVKTFVKMSCAGLGGLTTQQVQAALSDFDDILEARLEDASFAKSVGVAVFITSFLFHQPITDALNSLPGKLKSLCAKPTDIENVVDEPQLVEIERSRVSEVEAYDQYDQIEMADYSESPRPRLGPNIIIDAVSSSDGSPRPVADNEGFLASRTPAKPPYRVPQHAGDSSPAGDSSFDVDS